MSTENLTSLEATLKAIPDDAVRKPSTPVDVYCHQGERILKAAEKDRADLVATGIDAAVIDTLPTRLGALRTADAEWQVRRRRGRPEEQVARETAGFAMRNEAVATSRFGLRGDPDAQAVLDEIQKGDGLADMLDDCERLAVLYREKAARFAIPGFDAAREAARLETEAAAIRAGSAAWRIEESTDTLRDRRDRAYSHAALALDEIRAAARFAFRKDANDLRITPYVDTYEAAKNRRRRTAGVNASPTTTATTTPSNGPTSPGAPAAQSTSRGNG